MGLMTDNPLIQRLELFPVTAQVHGSGEAARLEIASCNLELLAEALSHGHDVFDFFAGELSPVQDIFPFEIYHRFRPSLEVTGFGAVDVE